MTHLIIFPGYYPPHIGGMETVASEQAEFLSQKYSVTVFCPHIPSDTPKYEIHNGIEIIRYPAFELINNFPLPKIWKPAFWRLLKQIKKNPPSLVITHTRFFSNSLLGALYARNKRITLAHFEHGSAFVCVSSKLTSFLSKVYDFTLGKFVINSATHVIAISEAVKSFLLEQLKVNKEVTTIYRGVKLETFDEIIPKPFNNNKINLIFVGRLFKWKGVENSILAIESLPKELQDKLCFHIIGDGEDYERLNTLIQNQQLIKMHGAMDSKEVISRLKAADIYLHSAYPGGGLATSLIEAMYCKNIIVASPHEGAREIVDSDVGFLLTDNNPQSLKEGIINAINQANNSELKECAHTRIKKSFNWPDKIKEYDALFINK